MAAQHGSESQYRSMENFMRAKFCENFPEGDVQAFNFWFIADKDRADGSGRQGRYSIDGRRFMGEQFTWRRFWPLEEFPGTRPIQMGNYPPTPNGNNQLFIPHRGRGRANYPQQHRGRGRGSMMSTRGGSRMGIRGQGHDQLTSHHDDHPRYNVNSTYDQPPVHGLHNAASSFEQPQGNLIDFVQNETTTERLMQDHGNQSTTVSGPIVTQDAQVMEGESDVVAVCRQCGVKGHFEIECRYKIVMKQTAERERHLVCGIPGHKAFRFNSCHGCLECKEKREEGGEGKFHVADVELGAKLTGVTGVKPAACDMEDADFNVEIETLTSKLATGIFEDGAETKDGNEQPDEDGRGGGIGGEDDGLISF